MKISKQHLLNKLSLKMLACHNKWHMERGSSQQVRTPLGVIVVLLDYLRGRTIKGKCLVISNVDILLALTILRDDDKFKFLCESYDINICKKVEFTLLTDIKGLNLTVAEVITVDNYKDVDKIDMMGRKFDVEIFNPPYTEKKGNFNKNIFDAFIYKGHELLTEDGQMIVVCPRAWFVADTGGRGVLRKFLFDNGLKLVKRLPDSVWEGNATVQTCVIVVEKQFKGNVTVVSEDNNTYEQANDNDQNYIFSGTKLNSIARKVMPKDGDARFKFANIYPTTKNMSKSLKPLKSISKLKGGGNSEFEYTEANWETADSDKYRVTHNFMGGLNRFAVDQMGILEPGIQNKKGYIQIACQDEQEAKNINSLLRTKVIRYVVDATRTSRTLSNTQFNFIPFYNDRLWTDEMAYEFFNITPEEIEVIESYEPKGA